MAVTLSGHLMDSFSANKSMNVVFSGPMSFNPTMHGSQAFNTPFAPFAFGTQPSYMSEEISEATAKKIAALQAKLNQKLGPEYISQRPGPGGGPKLTYAEGWKIINLANEVFGFNGWSSNVVNMTTDFVDYNEESRRFSVGVTAIVRVTLRDGVYHEDIGYGMLENSKSKGMAIDKCKKEAVTDGLKRALRNFGNLLGNCLYDKAYAQEVVKMKVTPPKFDVSELHRRPEFEVKSNVASVSNAPDVKPGNNGTTVNNSNRPSYPTPQQQFEAPPSLPHHMQRELNSATDATMNIRRANSPRTPLQLQKNIPITPITPASTNREAQNPRIVDGSKPQQPNQPPQRKVTFSDATWADINGTSSTSVVAIAPLSKVDNLKPEPDDSFEENFGYSEDDAFLASVDLGDADLGRPIEDDGDTGRPIDFDEGLGDASTTNSNVTASTNNNEQPTSNVGMLPLRTGPASGMLSGLLPRQGQRRGNLLPKDPSQHIPPAKSNAQTMGCSTRTAAPSIGGFYFPPGMNPLEKHDQNRSPAQCFNASVKRPAESTLTRLVIVPSLRGQKYSPIPIAISQVRNG
ncbi:hypothetical protein AX15_000379 [Amanita polypyramis BW_CC]|nr:hypothetical protein AX15_000379 [Amanita polypyramis BW_CC]